MKRKPIYLLIILFFQCFCMVAHAQSIVTTIAGTGSMAHSGDGGPASSASLFYPNNGFVDASGNIYITEMLYGHTVRKIDAATGIISTIAGTGFPGNTGDGGPATAAGIYWPAGIWVNTAGDIFMADSYSDVIRKIDGTTGIISRVAGTGATGYSGDGGPATSANLWAPNGICGDAAGNIFFTEYGSSTVRKITASTGIISTVAGTGVTGTSADGGAATAAKLSRPQGPFVDNSGNVYVADVEAHRIRKISGSTGIITTVAGMGTSGYSGDGGPATDATLFNPSGIFVDASSNIYIADASNSVIRKVTPAGIITTIAGNGTVGYSGDSGPATDAQLSGPSAVSVYSGAIYLVDNGNNVIRKVTGSTGLSEVNARGNIQVYPNPSGDVLSIAGIRNESEYRLINTVGVQIQQGHFQKGSGTIQMKDIPSGTYLLEVTDGDGSRQICRVIKL